MFRGTIVAATAVCILGGCPADSVAPTGNNNSLVPTDYDGNWQIASETGLANRCITILGDRITQSSECDGGFTLIANAEPSARSGNQIIWTYRTSDNGGEVLHTISVFVQPDGTLRGTYSLRTPDATIALTDNIIMVPRRVRV